MWVRGLGSSRHVYISSAASQVNLRCVYLCDQNQKPRVRSTWGAGFYVMRIKTTSQVDLRCGFLRDENPTHQSDQPIYFTRTAGGRRGPAWEKPQGPAAQSRSSLSGFPTLGPHSLHSVFWCIRAPNALFTVVRYSTMKTTPVVFVDFSFHIALTANITKS